MPQPLRVAFLGLGTMGAPMAANLVRAGIEVRGWNRSPDRPLVRVAAEAGVALCPSIEEAVKGATLVATCVSDVPDVEAVLLGPGGVSSHAPAGCLVADFSTIGPVAARRIAAALAQGGLRFLDAPVTGGDVGARAGTLTIMVGGSQADFDEAVPAFGAMGRHWTLCGPSGAGQAIKLCNQVLGALHMAAITEAFALARAQGVDPGLVVDVCKTGAAGSWALENLGPRVLGRDFAPGFMIKHLLKDLRLVLETPPSQGLSPLIATELVKDLYEKISRLSGGDELGTQALTLAYESA